MGIKCVSMYNVFRRGLAFSIIKYIFKKILLLVDYHQSVPEEKKHTWVGL